MPTQTLTTMPALHEHVPAGTDFVGGAWPLPVRPAEPADVIPGSDFAGGAVPLTSEVPQLDPEQR
jgi:hypothetical protein